MVFRIRNALPADVPAMHRIRLAVDENRLTNPEAIGPASYEPYVSVQTAWVAESDDGIMGFAVLDVSSTSVWALFVDPLAEGAGIGRRLHDHLIAYARQRNIERLTLGTGSGTRAEKFYEAAGWSRTGFNDAGEVQFERLLQS